MSSKMHAVNVKKFQKHRKVNIDIHARIHRFIQSWFGGNTKKTRITAQNRIFKENTKTFRTLDPFGNKCIWWFFCWGKKDELFTICLSNCSFSSSPLVFLVCKIRDNGIDDIVVKNSLWIQMTNTIFVFLANVYWMVDEYTIMRSLNPNSMTE